MDDGELTHVLSELTNVVDPAPISKRYKLSSPEDLTAQWQNYSGDKVLRMSHPEEIKIDPPKNKKGLKMSISKLKKLNLYDTSIEHHVAQQMNALWEEYIVGLAGNRTIKSTLKERVYDLQGASICIKFSSNPTQVGLSGIVFYDSAHVLWLSTPSNSIKKVAKSGLIFAVRCRGSDADVLGSAMLRKFHLRLTKPHKKLLVNQQLLTL